MAKTAAKAERHVAAGHGDENLKKQKRGASVKKQIRQVMSARFQPIELAVEHVRNGRQRMPVPRMRLGERGFEASDGQSAR